jgi:hypothetical protein
MLERITDEIADDIEARLRKTHNVTRVERTPRRITVHFNGYASRQTTMRQILDTEHAIITEYCNEPHLMYSDTTTYRFTLVCN